MIVLQLPTPTSDFESSLVGILEELIQQIPPERQTGELGIFKEIPDGWLPTNGTTFDQSQHPELFRALGGGTLPNFVSPFAGMLVAIKT